MIGTKRNQSANEVLKYPTYGIFWVVKRSFQLHSVAKMDEDIMIMPPCIVGRYNIIVNKDEIETKIETYT